MRTDDDACERDAFNTWMKRGKMDTRHLFFFPKIINQETNFSLTTKAIRRVKLEKKRAIRVERNLNILTSNVRPFLGLLDRMEGSKTWAAKFHNCFTCDRIACLEED